MSNNHRSPQLQLVLVFVMVLVLVVLSTFVGNGLERDGRIGCEASENCEKRWGAGGGALAGAELAGQVK